MLNKLFIINERVESSYGKSEFVATLNVFIISSTQIINNTWTHVLYYFYVTEDYIKAGKRQWLYPNFLQICRKIVNNCHFSVSLNSGSISEKVDNLFI